MATIAWLNSLQLCVTICAGDFFKEKQKSSLWGKLEWQTFRLTGASAGILKKGGGGGGGRTKKDLPLIFSFLVKNWKKGWGTKKIFTCVINFQLFMEILLPEGWCNNISNTDAKCFLLYHSISRLKWQSRNWVKMKALKLLKFLV